MRVDLFDFDLPSESIALRPASPRDAARLLVVEGQRTRDCSVSDLASLLKAGDVMVFNDTKVIPAQLEGLRPARAEGGGQGAHISVNLHKLESEAVWRAFVRPAKRLKAGDDIDFSEDLRAQVLADPVEGEVRLQFNHAGSELMVQLGHVGAPPLPPYISSKRETDARDTQDYQTIYADEEGSVAAPTAGLHFTPELFVSLKARGIDHEMVTLHVGAGTFLPMKSDDTDDHTMHSEWGEVSPEVAERLTQAKREGRRIVAVGTTSLRLLESATDEDGVVSAFDGETDIFITPGYKFRAVDILMTNFHLPRSTLFVLVCAFSGHDNMLAAYAHAIEAGYRFYSYGDAGLLFRDEAV